MKVMKKLLWIVLILISILMFVYLFRFGLADFIGSMVYRDYELQPLSIDEKIEDFEYFHGNMVQSAPYLEDIKEIYGIDFKERKEYYCEEIKKTKSNIEYYGVMKAISKDMASFHTDVCFPLFPNLQGLNCYASEEVLHQIGMKQRVEAWYKEFEEEVHNYEDVNLFSAVYIDGHYILNEGWLSEDYKEMAYYELMSVNDVPAEEFVLQNLSIFSLKYDGLSDKPYREAFLFNDTMGEEVLVKWRTQNGEIVEQKLYIHKGVEVVASYGYLESERFEYYDVESEGALYTFRDEENELEYIKINNMTNSKGQELKEYIENIKYDKVVIDLRDNYGGLRKYIVQYLLLPLYASNGKLEWEWKVPDTSSNEKMADSLAMRFRYYEGCDEEYKYYKESLEFEGEAEKDRDVYYLVGPDTGSAADWLVAMVKEKELGTIVGNNTGGEGLAASYICDSLPKTGLVYVYYPSICTSTNFLSSTGYGTHPDILVEQSIEDYVMFDKLRAEGNLNGYTSRLQYDTVLKWVIAEE